jgi:hypothetical protein
MDRIPACERTRERLKALMEGHGEKADLRSELVRLAARLIVEEGLEGEAADALGWEYYVRGAGRRLSQWLPHGSAEDGGGRGGICRAADL